jgi:ABC-type phosphate transport system substrate-binding protein
MDQTLRWLRIGMGAVVLMALPAAASLDAAEPVRVRVIANESVPTGVVSKKTLNAVFRGESARWSDGTLLRAVDQSVRSDIRLAFTRDFLNDTLDSIQAQWMRRIAQGRGLPPPVKASDADVMAFVASNRGGLGYVAEATPLVAGVKAVQVVE